MVWNWFVRVMDRCYQLVYVVWVRFVVFNAAFNNILVISWRLVLLVKESTRKKNNQPVASHRQTLSHYVVSSTPRHERVWSHNFIGDRYCTDCTGSCRFNHHTITTTTCGLGGGLLIFNGLVRDGRSTRNAIIKMTHILKYI